MRALPENIGRGQSNGRACEVVADQGQYFQVKPELTWLLFYLLIELITKTLKKNFLYLRHFLFSFCFLFCCVPLIKFERFGNLFD